MSEASAAKYKPIASDELDSSELCHEHHPKSSSRRWMLYAQVTCAVLLALTLGVFIGRLSLTITSHNNGLLSPPGEIHQVWQHNLTFSQSPTLESESAWASTVPVGRGFVHHAELAPFISGIAVFHQLHCLHAILVAYYVAQSNYQALLNGSLTSEPELFGARIETPHIRHCFDYLRRGIMCASDTNLEVVSYDNHTTNGWGQDKKCRDYGEVFEFAERWANSSDTGIVT